MAETTVKVLDTYNRINKAFDNDNTVGFSIRGFEAVDCKEDNSKMSSEELSAWDNEPRVWKLLIRHNNAGVLSRRKLYKGLKSLVHDLNTKKPITELPEIRILQSRVLYPMFGSKHTLPTGRLYVTDGIDSMWVELKEDTGSVSYYNGNYITFKRKRYYLKDEGHYMSSNFVVDVDKTLQYRNSKNG